MIESRNIDCEFIVLELSKVPNATFVKVPEIQGTATEVSREKCRRAAEIVSAWLNLHGPCAL